MFILSNSTALHLVKRFPHPYYNYILENTDISEDICLVLEPRQSCPPVLPLLPCLVTPRLYVGDSILTFFNLLINCLLVQVLSWRVETIKLLILTAARWGRSLDGDSSGSIGGVASQASARGDAAHMTSGKASDEASLLRLNDGSDPRNAGRTR